MSESSRDTPHTPPKNAEGAADSLPAPSNGYDDVNAEVCAIIQQCDELPKIIRMAEISGIVERRIDRQLLDTLEQDALETRAPVGITRGNAARGRKASLLPYLGRRLTRVLIRLPSIQYTIEIDREKGQVVYWEWRPV